MPTTRNEQPRNASDLALGSWHIFNRISLEDGAALVRRALDLGITLFDVGDYWDHDISNEARFHEIVQRLGLARSDYRVGIKVFTNSVETRAQLVKASLMRLGIEQADYVVCSRPSDGESVEAAIAAMSALVTDGLTRDIAVSLWRPDMLGEALGMMEERGFHKPRFLQLQYNVCRRSVVESDEYRRLFTDTGIRMQAADALEGGILTGHVHRDRFNPGDREQGRWFEDRNVPRDSGGIRPAIRERVASLAAAAASWMPHPRNWHWRFACCTRTSTHCCSVRAGLPNSTKTSGHSRWPTPEQTMCSNSSARSPSTVPHRQRSSTSRQGGIDGFPCMTLAGR